METQLRRDQITLVTLGTGIILFGAWSVLKFILYYRAGYAQIEIDIEPELLVFVEIFAFLLVGLILLADFGLRLYIGRAARAEGMGRRQKSAYLYLAAALLVSNAISDLYSVYAVVNGISVRQSYLDFVVSFFVDLTSLALLAWLLVTVRRVRRLRAMLEG